ncbi:MAG: OmpA family protein [Bacteroidota bacterium]
MKKQIFLLFNLTACIFSFAQNYIYKNDFTDPLVNEKTSVTDDSRIELKDGYLFCEQKKLSFYWCIAERVFIDTEKDYEIEMKVKPYKIDPYFSEFGLIFGLKNVSMFNSFTVSSSGDVSVDSKVYDTEIPYLGPMPVAGYKSGDWCLFRLAQRQGKMYFYFNNQLVFERKKIDMMGRWFGWYTNGQTGIQIDHFYVKQDRGSINLYPEAAEFKKERVKKINSEKDEVNAQISSDGKNFYFARFINPSTSFYTVCKDGSLGFYSAESDSTGEVFNPDRMQLPIKNPWYIASVPTDRAFLAGEKDNHFTSSGYQLAKCNLNSGTTEPSSSVKFGGSTNISIRHASVSKDGNVMLISGYESYEPYGLELFVSIKNGTTWSIPKKISSLNTRGDEVTPFISSDMKKIYFSSDGHPGYGFSDVFVAERLDESWLNWSKPMNMGKGINDASFNEFFVMPDTSVSQYAYLSSCYGNINNLDLYKVRVKKTPPVEQPLVLKGKIIYADQKDKKLDGLTINLNGKKNLNLDVLNDEFACQVKKGDIFAFQLLDTSYVILEKKVLDSKGTPTNIEVVLKVAKIKTGESFVLENIYFTANKFDLLSTSFPALDALAQAMLNNPKLKIEIQGHTSKTNESVQFNLELSSQRANAVRNYLLTKGISEKRMIAKGYGYTQPLYNGDDAERQAANRRVEIKILEK